MSRIGRMPIAVPAGVTVDIAENNHVTVKGPKGTLERTLPSEMDIKLEGAKELQQTAAELDQMRNLITETAYVRFKYAVFPGFMMNKSLGKLLKKVDPALSPYNLLTGLSYKTAEMNRQMK